MGYGVASSFTRAIPGFKRVCMRFLAYRKVEGKTPGLTLNEESNVGNPYAKRNRYNNPVFVPNGYAKVIHEAPVTENSET
jgi:hypothetical protein